MKFNKLTYSKLTQMTPNTRKFKKANEIFFKINRNIDGLKRIGNNRKTGYEEFKKNLLPSQVFTMALNDTKYINEVKKRDFMLLNGDYMRNKSQIYINNYLSSLTYMTIDQDIKDFLSENRDIILEGLLPEIDNYYIYIKSKSRTRGGKAYTVNVDEATKYENVMKAVINEFYGDKWKEWKATRGKKV